ncbi:uncharacterized protein LOC132703978 isoform X2 [Cylas formicarius]|uniref:uncharacterized protein LOC132703978 isoform X2 n=1 Tax=Cylas formicarius TaxID=197179 RepID=UPI0029589DE9|nr:uncharacterized protein LOC132703978 isoform X2 [Cylas formicarius]
MCVYWKALLGYGFVFWTLLCITDFVGITQVHNYRESVDWFREPPDAGKKFQDNLEPDSPDYSFIKIGWSFLLWNLVVFICSVVVCYIGRYAAYLIWKRYQKRITKVVPQLPKSNDRIQRSLTTFSKIPRKINAEKSCPNLLTRRTGSSLSTHMDETKTLYTNNSFNNNDSIQIENPSKRYRDELVKYQIASMKDHAALSMKLEAVTIEKKELSKQLALAQKENRAAKQQLEELVEEKSALVKKLETATREFKNNTKSKKAALGKLEEATENAEKLRLQLEQVSRDKEILEKKLGLLENEYTKLHERFIDSQRTVVSTVDENVPERDRDRDKDSQFIQNPFQALASVSQTELDMKNIQQKIKQLEKNLENFNMSSNELMSRNNFTQGESELSLTTLESQIRLDEDDTFSYAESGYSGNSPRQKYWSERVAELVGRNKNKFVKIQELAIQMREKAKLLGHIGVVEDYATDGHSSGEDREPRRIVSSSLAFKNFLRRSVHNPIIY